MAGEFLSVFGRGVSLLLPYIKDICVASFSITYVRLQGLHVHENFLPAAQNYSILIPVTSWCDFDLISVSSLFVESLYISQ